MPAATAMETPHDVVIVGAGVIGLACALALLQRGRGVVLYDASRAGGATSHGNCGTITPSHAAPLPMPGMPWQVARWMLRRDAPFYLRPRWDPALFGWLWRALRRCNRRDFEATAAIRADLLTASRERLADLVARHDIDCEYRAAGSLYAFRDRAAFARFGWHADLLQRLGIDVEAWSGADIQQREPALNERVVAGYFHPGDAQLRPDRLMAGLARAVRAAGGVIHEDTPVCALRHDRHGAVTGIVLDDGEVAAGAVLVAAASASPALLRPLGLRVPVQPGKGYSLTFTRPARVPATAVVLKEASVCVTAWADGFRLGSTMEFSGFDATLNPLRLGALRRAAADYLREPEGDALLAPWYGWRPMTPDDLPLVGAVPDRPGLWLATGHGMLGVSLAAITAELIAARMLGERPPLDDRALAPTRHG